VRGRLLALGCVVLCIGLCLACGGTASIAINPDVISGGASSFKLNAEGNILYSWGENGYGSLGLGDIDDRTTPVVLSALSGRSVKFLVAGEDCGFAVLADNSVYAWGTNAGQLGFGDSTYRNTPERVSSFSDLTLLSLSSGVAHTLALGMDRHVYTCGQGGVGQLGLGDEVSELLSPQEVPGLPTSVGSVSAGWYDCYAICTDGSLWAWGANGFGELGIGDSAIKYSPVLVPTFAPSGVGVTAVAGGEFFAVFLCSNGWVYSCGVNGAGALGLGLTPGNTQRLTPEHVTGLLSDQFVKAVAVGEYHTLALTTGGQVYSWGGNFMGQLGLGDTTERNVPVLVEALADKFVLAIAAGVSHSLALCSDGSVYAWGGNSSGQLGLGDTEDRDTPQIVTFP